MKITNRTLKFRVYNNKTKSWIHGPHERPSLDGVNLFGETILFSCILDGISIEDIEHCDALQYTGLVDVHDKEIFEGDIVKIQVSDDPENLEWELLYVGFVSGAFVLINRGFLSFDDFITGSDHSKLDVEVVGNIYDNGDLLQYNA